MTEFKYSTHVYDLSFKREDIPIDLGGNSINVIAVTHDCYVKVNEKWEDPINLMHVGSIKSNFNKLYLSNKVNVGGYVAIIIGGCDFELKTNIVRPQHKPLELPQQNIPQHLQGWVIDRPQIVNIWDIEKAIFLHSFNTSLQDTNPTGLYIKPDGLKLYTTGKVNDKVYEYDLTKAWDVSTATFLHSFSVGLQATIPSDLFLSKDGKLLYVTDHHTNSIFQYSLTTPWNITTSSHKATFDTTLQTGLPSDVKFSPCGYNMYVTGRDVSKILQYSLSVPWDITTATFVNSFDISFHINEPSSIFVSPDGLKFYVIARIPPTKVIAFRLMKAWDITTAVYVQSFDYGGILTGGKGLFFKYDGSRMYIISEISDNIYEFKL